jgi:hypothetical protein
MVDKAILSYIQSRIKWAYMGANADAKACYMIVWPSITFDMLEEAKINAEETKQAFTDHPLDREFIVNMVNDMGKRYPTILCDDVKLTIAFSGQRHRFNLADPSVTLDQINDLIDQINNMGCI